MSHPFRIDWSQLWYPGPTRRFSEQEMKVAGADAPSATLSTILMINTGWLSFMVLQMAPQALTARLSGLLIGLLVSALGLGRILWLMPSRRGLNLLATVYLLVWAGVAFALKLRVDDPVQRMWCVAVTLGTALLMVLIFFFVTIYRAHQIELRLKEIDERKRAEAAKQQLASAQIQPHFLFNSLASLQHWVHTRDERAGPLLASLTAYLRATLPLFNRQLLTVDEELQAVQHYLEVMQARLGARLSWQVEVSAELRALQLPPALVLTLVENAVEHGVQASLNGASVAVRGGVIGAQAWLEVRDTGPGLATSGPALQEGTGLANSRLRLSQAFGDEAHLSLANDPAGGCIARLDWPAQVLPESRL